jgi:hypothetical protein
LSFAVRDKVDEFGRALRSEDESLPGKDELMVLSRIRHHGGLRV